MIIREIAQGELLSLLTLYAQLHDNEIPAIDSKLELLWSEILSDKNHHILGGFIDDVLVSSCVIVIIPNLTQGQRPYALIENVITDQTHRNNGYSTLILNFAKEIALKENCYKIMLLTGSKNESTIEFYEKAGYNRHDKIAFIQWI